MKPFTGSIYFLADIFLFVLFLENTKTPTAVNYGSARQPDNLSTLFMFRKEVRALAGLEVAPFQPPQA